MRIKKEVEAKLKESERAERENRISAAYNTGVEAALLWVLEYRSKLPVE